MSSSTPPDPLFTVRAALVLLLAVLTGVAAGALTYFSTHSTPGAVLAGGSALGAALLLFHAVIGR